MRVHELALQRWLYGNFFVVEGVPVPVIFSSPLDAFSGFKQLWANENHPYKYLLDAKDDDGTPLYLPHPEPVRYPLISVHRKGWNIRAAQNYSIHRQRHVSWPTVSGDVKLNDLATVNTARRPMAWNARFQVDFFCLRPDTQSHYVDTWMRKLWMTGGGTPRFWLVTSYPGYFGHQLVHVVLDNGDIANSTWDEVPDDQIQEFRTTVNLTVEGWVPFSLEEYPALWSLILRSKVAANLEELAAMGGQEYIVTTDLRFSGSNPLLETRSPVPS